MTTAEAWYALDGKTPPDRRRDLRTAAALYHRRFGVEPRGWRVFRVGRKIYVGAEVER